MRTKDLRWSHIHAVIAALEAGESTADARLSAMIGRRVWIAMRRRKMPLDLGSLLRKQDPDGVPAYLSLLDELVARNVTGRPVTTGMATVRCDEAYEAPGEDVFA